MSRPYLSYVPSIRIVYVTPDEKGVGSYYGYEWRPLDPEKSIEERDIWDWDKPVGSRERYTYYGWLKARNMGIAK